MFGTEMLTVVDRTGLSLILDKGAVVVQPSGEEDESIIDSFTEALRDSIEGGLVDLAEFLPALITALIILAIGNTVGNRLEPFVARLVNRLGVDAKMRGTRVGDTIQSDGQQRTDGGANTGNNQPPQNQPPRGARASRPQYGPVAIAAGVVVKYYIILFAAFLAAQQLGIAGLIRWLDRLVGYAPQFLAGAAVIVVGLVFADYVAGRIRDSDVSEESDYGTWMPATAQALLYAIVLILGLEMIGFDLQFVYILGDGVASSIGVGLTFAIAVAVGIVGGLFAKDYYENNMRTAE